LCALLEAVREQFGILSLVMISRCLSCITPYKTRGADRRLVKGHAREYDYIFVVRHISQMHAATFKFTIGNAPQDVDFFIGHYVIRFRERIFPASLLCWKQDSFLLPAATFTAGISPFFLSMKSQFLTATFTVSNCIGRRGRTLITIFCAKEYFISAPSAPHIGFLLRLHHNIIREIERERIPIATPPRHRRIKTMPSHAAPFCFSSR
jgi:hypothetical protein